MTPASGLPDLSPEAVGEREAYFGLGKALLEFESAVYVMEQKCKGEMHILAVTDFCIEGF